MSTLTLRGEVEALIASLSVKSHEALMDNRCIESVEKGAICHQLRAILSRHADEVSVPRELLLRIGVKLAKSLPKTNPMTYDDDLSALLAILYVKAADIAQSDAILGETK